MSDPLSRATRALKELHAEAPAPPPDTRERVLERADFGTRERRVSRAILVPLAAAFLLFGAWAAASGALARSFSSSGAVEPGAAVSVTAPSAAPSPAAGRPPPSAESEPSPAPSPAPAPAPAAPSADVVVQTPAPAVVVEPSRPSSVAPAPPVPTPASPSAAGRATTAERGSEPAPAASAPPSDGLYAVAHRAHFQERDPARALAAWDAYLGDAPQGRFAPEARYNRALCLVRLGRTNEAIAALRPFAEGAYGSYRREEATRLLSAMGDAATP
jgi:hypothetical protein